MEKYSDFLRRISYQQPSLMLPGGHFNSDGRVLSKVDESNGFKPFFGDTVVFELGAADKRKVERLARALHTRCPECFCNPLGTGTYHMTLHDLSASDNLDEVSRDMFFNELKLIEALKEAKPVRQTIKMKTNFIINMVNTSLVLALVPADEAEWNKLQIFYSLVDKVRVCPYPYLTPHVTLAYFNRFGFDERAADKLKSEVEKLNYAGFEITLNTKKLFYQKFTDMNSYINVFALT